MLRRNSTCDLGQALDQFEAAMESGAEARALHVGASAELRTLSDEVVQAVNVLDRFNRQLGGCAGRAGRRA